MKKVSIGLLVLAVLAIIGSIASPITGKWALVGEACAAAGCLLVGTSLLLDFVARRKTEARGLLAALLILGVLNVGFAVPMTTNVIQDIVWGTTEAVLTDCEVQYVGTSSGIINLSCYLVGNDENGNEVRVQISGSDAKRFASQAIVEVEYYPNTMRAASLSEPMIIKHRSMPKY